MGAKSLERPRSLIVGLAAVVIATVFVAAPAEAKSLKLDVCHAVGNGSYNLITISERAVQKHLAKHGDGIPGENVPEMDGAVFDDFCQPVVPVPIVLTNAGFEDPDTGNLVYFSSERDGLGPQTVAGWTYTGFSGLAKNGGGFTAGNDAAPEGTQVAFLQVSSNDLVHPTTVSQTFNSGAGPVTFTFDASLRSGNIPIDLEVLVDGILVGTFVPPSTSYQTFVTTSASLAAGPHVVTFHAVSSATVGDSTVFIDNVQVP